MAKTTDIIKTFETILKENACNHQSTLYSGNKPQVFGNNAPKLSIDVDQVISNVSRQIKAIQSADCHQKRRSAVVNIDKYKKSSIVPVNMLAGAELMPQNTNLNKFETQCVTDTQLINIVQDAEDLVSNRGMTQEFDTTFCTQEAVNMSPLQKVSDNRDFIDNNNIVAAENKGNNPVHNKQPIFPIVDISLKEPDRSDDVDSLIYEKDARNDEHMFAKLRNLVQTELFNEPLFTEIGNQAQVDILHKASIEEDKTRHNNFNDRSISSSPVFSIKEVKKSVTPPPLVFELEAFEKFENIAIPIFEKNTDTETAKFLINSQILGKELYVQSESEPVFYEDEYKVSPFIEWSESKFNFDQVDEYLPAKDDRCILETKSKHSNTLKDEILFSSDEENECGLQEYNVDDLPFTCALATSFYEQPHVLDKTMYVGFQTASNKSIQVCTESFYKAKSVFNDFEKDVSEKSSLTELVEICDAQSFTEFVDSTKNYDGITIKSNKQTVRSDTIVLLDCKDKNTPPEYKLVNQLPTVGDLSEKSIKISQQLNFEGFRTASNKQICISEKSLEQSNKIFEDISLSSNENCKVVAIKENNCKPTYKSFECKRRDNKSPVLQQVTVKNKKEFNLDDSILIEFENNNLLHENIDKCRGNDLVGFKTASNKNIKISESAYEKTKKIFQDIDAMDDVYHKKSINTDLVNSFKQINVGFKTASNKGIKISDKAVAKTKNIFQDIEMLDEKDVWNQPSTSTTSFVGFKTANNKEIKITDVAKVKTKKIFEDIFSNDVVIEKNSVKRKSEYSSVLNNKRRFHCITDETDKLDCILGKNCNLGFQTASNKKIKISEKALIKSQNMFKDVLDKDSDDDIIRNKEIRDSKTQFKDFQTASNKPVNISIHAVSKTKSILEKNKDYIDANKNTSKSNKNPAILKGFHTASNKLIKISEQALIHSKKIFENIDKEIDVKEIKGFKTASNKLITVSEEALVKSSKVFDNINDGGEKMPFKGFQIDSNKKVEISEKSESKKIFEIDNSVIDNKEDTNFEGIQTTSNLDTSENIFKNNDIEYKSVKIVKKDAFQGFQTASNEKVNISKKALARSYKIFENFDRDIEEDEVPINNTFQGFQTGHNKKVDISEQALAKSRKLLEDIDDKKFAVECPYGFPFKGFKTESNREVKISKEALAKTKGIFQDIDISSETANSFTDCAISQVIPIKSANQCIQDTFRESESNFTDSTSSRFNEKLKTDFKEHLLKIKPEMRTKDTVYVENVIDTQFFNDFDKSLHTEDFTKAITPAKSKRSGSPILSCPKAKRRKKFETPYNKTPKNMITPAAIQEKGKNDDIKIQTYIFNKEYKKTKKFYLNDINYIEKESPSIKISVDPQILEYKFENLLNFQFFGTRNELSNEKWTTDDLKKYFLNSVNKNLVPDGWIDNHLKLIIWKLISYEVKFPNTLGVVCTSQNVIEQLKYRYDKELFNSERPALRKIMEKDDVSTKLMVLCVAAVYEVVTVKLDDKVTHQKPVELLLTDGWYCIRACLDRMLSKLVADGKIAVGGKIVTSGAELVGCEQGVAPWEDTSQVRLKLSGNSTRRARWHARLGYHGNGAILTRLRDVRPDGGRVAKLRVLVTRVYPTLHIEKFDDGSTVTRSERLELLHQMKYENERQGLLEKLYEEVQKEFSDEESQESEVDPNLERRCFDSGSQIAKAMKKSHDPADLRSNLTETQVELLNDHTTRKRDRLVQDIQARVEERMAESGLNVRRNVVPLMKIRVADVRERGDVEVTKGLMSIWKPNDAIAEIVNEGSWIEVMNVLPTGIRYSEIQISAGRQSIFSQSKHKESEKLKPFTKSMKRTCYPIKDLARNPSMTTEYNEIDTVGLIFLIEPSTKEFDSLKNQFQNVYLADADKNMICVNFWGGLKKLGFENIMDTGQIIACMNLQKRAGNTRKNIPQYRVTEFSYFTTTPKNDASRNASEDLDKKLLGFDKMKFCDDCVSLKNNYSVLKQNYSENVSPYRFQNIDMNLSKNKIFIGSPLTAKSGKSDENLNLSGLDFESTFKQVDTQEHSPKTMLRKRQIKEKINKLKMYGEPPALSPMHILNKSKNAGSAFKSPLPKSDAHKSVVNASESLLKENIVESCETPVSPVIMNRTYVKRTNVNPVKLDFNSVAIDDSNKSDTFDHFAEEFDNSPPLSLD